MNNIRILMMALFSAYPAFGDPLPPLGERVYSFHQDYDIVVIQPIEVEARDGRSKESLLMRDPILPSHEELGNFFQQDVLEARDELPDAVPAKLSFKNQRIIGRYAVPRLAFGSEGLAVGRADERFAIRPIERIFKTNKKLEKR